ncbi:MAG: hypothetical protein NT154_07545 [Verrucomicrobia bacterium]|nr:hypothetical protein [Verrucomicrobiota bacterium]
MSFDLKGMYELLPAVDRIRDVEQGEPLKALLTVIAEQVAVLEQDLAQSYDDHFIETCADWVVPYIGDLIGYRALRGEVPGIRSPRAEVANTIGYRRRKGTVVALEQLTRDVTGWHAHVVEFFQRLATTQYMNHLRPDNRSPYIGGLTRDILKGDLSRIERPLWEPLERLNTPFDTLAHTLDVRRIPPRRGRYNIPNIGIFVWRLNSYPLTDAQPFKLDDRRYFFSPLGNDTPLFTLPETLEEFSGLSTRMNVPEPISRRVLGFNSEIGISSISLGNPCTIIMPGAHGLTSGDMVTISGISDGTFSPTINATYHATVTSPASFTVPVECTKIPTSVSSATVVSAGYFGDYYGAGKSILLTVMKDFQETPVTSDQITVCDLSDSANGAWAHQPLKKIAIDPVLGRIAFPSNPDLPAVSPADVRVTFHCGFSADMGGGEYDRSATIPADFVETADGTNVTWQIGVSGTSAPIKDELVATLAEAVKTWNGLAAGAVGVIVIMDSGSYDLKGMSDIAIPDGSKLLIIAAGWPQVTDATTGQKQRVRGQFNAFRCRPHLRENIQVKGVPASAKNPGKLFLNGLLIEGSLTVTDRIQSLSVSHSTLVPGLGLSPEGFPKSPGAPSLVVTSSDPNLPSDVSIVIDSSIVGGIRVDTSVSTSVTNSIVDATSPLGVAFSGAVGQLAGGLLQVENSTLIGKVHTTLMELATNTIFFARLTAPDSWLAPVWSEQHQAGCVRFSYVPPGSRTPRRYRCQPANDADAARVSPQFGSLHYGAPDYAQLSRRCPPEIVNGADDESEMGAYHHLFEPQRITNLGVRLNEYLRFGLEAGIFFEPHLPGRVTPDPSATDTQPTPR